MNKLLIHTTLWINLKSKLYMHKRNSPGHLPDPGIKPRSPALQADSLPPEPPGKPFFCIWIPNYSSITCGTKYFFSTKQPLKLSKSIVHM